MNDWRSIQTRDGFGFCAFGAGGAQAGNVTALALTAAAGKTLFVHSITYELASNTPGIVSFGFEFSPLSGYTQIYAAANMQSGGTDSYSKLFYKRAASFSLSKTLYQAYRTIVGAAGRCEWRPAAPLILPPGHSIVTYGDLVNTDARAMFEFVER